MKWLIVVLAIALFIPRPALAVSENFKTSYDITYTVSDDGNTHVVLKAKLTNTTSQFYASSYQVSVGFAKIHNLKAFDEDGEIIPKVSKTEDGQSIKLTFNKKVVGISKNLPFSLFFDTKEVAQKLGEVWEVNIPGITNQDAFEDLSVHVRVPESFGQPTFIKPKPANTINLDYNKEGLGKSGISLGFGNKQYYAFNLKYHLKNDNIFPIQTEIALPPKTGYQDVVIDSIDPKPNDIRIDTDGNSLAKYSLPTSKNLDITVKGRVVVNLKPKNQPLSSKLEREYLKQKPYWETNKKIHELAKSLKTPDAIYEYIVKNLVYDFSRVTGNSPRLGAKAVLDNPNSAVCLEFTDLFVAIARAAGIPSREVDGFAYTQNPKQRPLSLIKDILHAWPEYYDKNRKSWIMIDPTWGNTTGGLDYFYTLDFDHIAFVIKGISSTYPIPAGGYKIEGLTDVKDVEISFTEPFEIDYETVFADLPKTPATTTIAIPTGGVLLAGFTIVILIIATGGWYLLFFRRKK